MRIELTVVPKSSRTCLVRKGQELKLRVTVPPVDDQANAAVIDYFAKLLSYPKKSIRIASGLRSKKKILVFDTSDDENIYSKIEDALQK